MARGVQVSKMGVLGKRGRSKSWGVSSKKRAKTEEARYRGTITRVRRPDFGYPDKVQTRLRYADVYSLTGSAGAIGNNVFRMNGCNDPDFSGVGHQPMFYDQFAGAVGSAPYSRYRVLGTKLKVTFSISSPPSLLAANYGPTLVAVIPQMSNALLASTVSGVMETDNSNWAVLCDKTGGNNVKTLTATYSPVRDIGVDSGDDTVAAAYNANPSQQFYCHVMKVDTVGPGTVQAFVEIEYLVEFFQRNEVNQS